MERLRHLEGEENIHPLVERLTLKRDLLSQGDLRHTGIPTIGFIEGGGVTAAWALGVVRELHDLGYKEVFDREYAYSAGALIAAVELSGQFDQAEELLWGGDLTRGIADPLNLIRKRDIMSMRHLDTVLRHQLKLDTDAIRNSRTQFFIGVTNEQGQGEFLDARDPNIDIVRALVASCALPVGYNKHVLVNGKKYSDGGVGWGVPIDFMLESGGPHEHAQSVLAVINKPAEQRRVPHWIRTAYSHMVVGKYFSEEFHKVYKAIPHVWNMSLFHHRTDIPATVGVIAPDTPIPEFNRSIPHLHGLYKQGRQAVRRIGFGRGGGN